MNRERCTGIRKEYFDEYRTWTNVIQRATNPKAANPKYYAGRGICQGWAKSFEKFLADMGPRPDGKSIDRIDGSLGYTCGNCVDCILHGWKSNCRWATPNQQTRNISSNRYYEFSGKKQILPDWAKELGFELGTLRSRLRTGWSIEKTLSTPTGECGKNCRMITLHGVTLPLSEMERYCGLKIHRAWKRLKRGMSVEDAFTPPQAKGDRKANGQFNFGSSAWKYRTKNPVDTTPV